MEDGPRHGSDALLADDGGVVVLKNRQSSSCETLLGLDLLVFSDFSSSASFHLHVANPHYPLASTRWGLRMVVFAFAAVRVRSGGCLPRWLCAVVARSAERRTLLSLGIGTEVPCDGATA